MQLKELESRHKSFDNQLRMEIGKISERSESYHKFRETYSFVSIRSCFLCYACLTMCYCMFLEISGSIVFN